MNPMTDMAKAYCTYNGEVCESKTWKVRLGLVIDVGFSILVNELLTLQILLMVLYVSIPMRCYQNEMQIESCSLAL